MNKKLWLICGTVPEADFPLCMGTWRISGDRLIPDDVRPCSQTGKNAKKTAIPSVPIRRGTPALAASAILAAQALGAEAPEILLVGDCGDSKGSSALYEFLAQWLTSPRSEELAGLTFHYLFPSVDGHNRILMALDERTGQRPVLIADAGFMYAAKMSGYASRWDIFTPDAGELAFLADEKAPHPFYTRGFLLSDGHDAPTLARLAHEHGDSARFLLVKGRTDIVVNGGQVTGSVSSPCLPFMEPIGGTGDLVTGLLTAYALAGLSEQEACLAAAQAARFVGQAADPTPATSVADLMPFIREGIRKTAAHRPEKG
ncbi:MAG: sugar kinase [Mailhella sp.]|nr:sugar kinase [Mailhella sp.]